ncbi:hypothetical protein ACX27_30315 [Nostoc piscinale CENA21]|uniref:Uncharacterized protein n=1 Tax=Nostoc piscinale CENA21 TaxID=224013 RepID=A0A0M4TPU9_9NOSO|nr:hypothetical protein ACX27_30315 [Nostoc piscinale CENA21]
MEISPISPAICNRLSCQVWVMSTIKPRSACGKLSAVFRILVSSPKARLRAKDLAERDTLLLTNWISSITRPKLLRAFQVLGRKRGSWGKVGICRVVIVDISFVY